MVLLLLVPLLLPILLVPLRIYWVYLALLILLSLLPIVLFTGRMLTFSFLDMFGTWEDARERSRRLAGNSLAATRTTRLGS